MAGREVRPFPHRLSLWAQRRHWRYEISGIFDHDRELFAAASRLYDSAIAGQDETATGLRRMTGRRVTSPRMSARPQRGDYS
jgi:hypothetical protein